VNAALIQRAQQMTFVMTQQISSVHAIQLSFVHVTQTSSVLAIQLSFEHVIQTSIHRYYPRQQLR
jgi:hypothetical protein